VEKACHVGGIVKLNKIIVSMLCYSVFMVVGICLCFIGFQSVHIHLYRSGGGLIGGTVTNTYIGACKINHRYEDILSTEILSTKRTTNLKINSANANDRIFFGDNQNWHTIKTLESKINAFLLNNNESTFEDNIKTDSLSVGVIGIFFILVSLLYIGGLLGLKEINIGKLSIRSEE
jgi:hypothetical protein